MNLLCPNCQKMLTIQDQYAGQLMKCPLCTNTFTAPSLPGATPPNPPPAPAVGSGPAAPAPTSPKEDVFSFAPTPSPPPATEPSPPKSEPPPPKPQETTAPVSVPAEYRHTATIWISPRVVPWVAPVALMLIFVLLFSTWIDWPGNSEGSQSGWGTGFGKHFSVLGLFYILLFLLTLVLALACLIVPRLQMALPPALQQLWPWRSAFVLGLVCLAYVFLVLEVLVGFGLESSTKSEIAAVSANLGTPVYYALHRTFWLRLAVLAHTLALVGAALDFWLILRKNRPLPRIDISW
jgi:hypothetical protein